MIVFLKHFTFIVSPVSIPIILGVNPPVESDQIARPAVPVLHPPQIGIVMAAVVNSLVILNLLAINSQAQLVGPAARIRLEERGEI